MKSKYETHVKPYLDRIRLWVAKGATCKEVADKLSITRESLNQYKRKYPDLYNALKAPQGEIDDEVEASLLKRCQGYNYEEVPRWQTIGPGGQIIWLEKRTMKHLPPDPSSIQFWLRNRRPSEWNKPVAQETQETGDTGVVMLPEVKDE